MPSVLRPGAPFPGEPLLPEAYASHGGEANLSALEIKLSADETSTLDKLLHHTPHIADAGATVNGHETQTPANLPASDADRY